MPSQSGSLQVVEERLSKLVGEYGTKRERARKQSARLVRIQLVAAGFTTLLVGLDAPSSWYARGALAASVLATGAATWLATFSYRERWISFLTTQNALRNLQSELLLKKSLAADDPDWGDISAEYLSEFNERISDLLGANHKQWSTIVAGANGGNVGPKTL